MAVIKLVSSLSISFVFFAFFIAYSMLDYTHNVWESFVPLITSSMFLFGTMQLLIITFARNATFIRDYTGRLSRFFIEFNENTHSERSALKLGGMAVFCIVGVYVTDLIYLMAYYKCSHVYGICKPEPIRYSLQAQMGYHAGRIYFASVSAVFCYWFNSRRFTRNFPALLTLMLTAVCAMSIWFRLVLDESEADQRHGPEDALNTTLQLITFDCFDGLMSVLSSKQAENLIKCARQNTSEFQLVENVKPYLYPIIAELMILYAESYVAWFFGSVVVKRSPNRPDYEPIPEDDDSDTRRPGLLDDVLNQNNQNPAALVQNPVAPQGQNPDEHPLPRNLYMYLMALASGLMCAVFIILGLLYDYFYEEITDNEIARAFAYFRIFYWIIFTALSIAGYVASKFLRTPHTEHSVKGLEYFVVLLLAGVIMFETFTMVAIYSDVGKNNTLFLMDRIFNIFQIVSQVIFYFWAWGFAHVRAVEIMVRSNRKAKFAMQFFDAILISFTVINFSLWFEDSFVETTRKVSESFEKQFYDHWPNVYNTLNPMRLLFRFNSAVLFFELLHR